MVFGTSLSTFGLVEMAVLYTTQDSATMTAVGRRATRRAKPSALSPKGWQPPRRSTGRHRPPGRKWSRGIAGAQPGFAGADFFGYDGRWALDLRATGKRPSPRQCREKRQTYEKHVLPVVGEVKLHQVNRALLKDFRNDMFQGSYSSSTINRALDCIRAVLEAAEDEERIPAVPRTRPGSR